MESLVFKLLSLLLLLNEAYSFSMVGGGCAGKLPPVYFARGKKIHRCSRFGRGKRSVVPLQEDQNGKCWSIMDNAGIDSAYFPFATAHRIHSMSLQDLRNFIDPEAPRNNGIPTLMDAIVVNNTIDVPSPFRSDGLRAMDSVLQNVNNLDQMLHHAYSDEAFPKLLHMTLHKFHMQDLWSMMKPVYDELVKNPPKDKEVCSCVKDVKNNQVVKYLEWMASGEGEVHDHSKITETFNNDEVYEFWMDDLRQDFLQFYEEKTDTHSAAFFIYCMLNE